MLGVRRMNLLVREVASTHSPVMAAPWASLPELPLLHVGAFLAPRDLTRAARVCSAWRPVMLSDALWRPLCAWQWLATEALEAGRSYHERYAALHRQYGRFRNYREMKYVDPFSLLLLPGRHLRPSMIPLASCVVRIYSRSALRPERRSP